MYAKRPQLVSGVRGGELFALQGGMHVHACAPREPFKFFFRGCCEEREVSEIMRQLTTIIVTNELFGGNIIHTSKYEYIICKTLRVRMQLPCMLPARAFFAHRPKCMMGTTLKQLCWWRWR